MVVIVLIMNGSINANYMNVTFLTGAEVWIFTDD